jgi:predicted ATPase/class 3 adenylate cyclase
MRRCKTDAVMNRLRVFISSSASELPDEREAARAAVRTLRLTALEPGSAELGDVFVGVYWQSYGWTAPDAAVSVLEEEYLRATELPRLVYVKEPAPEREPELSRLLAEMRAVERVRCRTFGAPGELAEHVIDDLAALMSERFYGGRTPTNDLPEGTVSFLFADMDGSTPLVRRLGERYPAVLDAFRQIVTGAVRASGGAVVDFDGDGAFCAFSAPAEAARAAVAVQRSLAQHAWPDDVRVRARIGLHCGEAQRAPDGYVGLEVHRAARIGAAANGGQILLSGSAASALEGDPMDGWSLQDLGSFALKGLDRAERLVQLVSPDLEHHPTAPRARGASSVKLPTHLTRLVGRDAEIADVVSHLEDHGVRLLTLTGPGGMGKTRLAVAAAAQASSAYPDGVFFVPLAEATSPEQVTATVAESLGVRGEGSRPLPDTIAEQLAADRVLLVLDNFEQVLGAAAVVAELLGSCPGAEVLVTSRIPLRVRGEREYPVPPLRVPGADMEGSAALECAAVQLFLDRARAVRPSWTPSRAEAQTVAEICRRLDGLPLAIELAASRLRVLDPESLLERLGTRLDVVGGSLPDLPDRQRTLTATIDWSHELLDEAERIVFARLSLFVGGWTVDAAEAVCADERVPDVLDTLERLVEHNLVVNVQGTPRMRMLETIREYAAARLEATAEADDVRARHADYFDRFIRESHSLFTAERLHLLDAEWDNIQAVLVPSRVAARAYKSLVELASLTWRYVWLRDRVRDSTTWMRDAYEVRDTLEPSLRGELCRLWGSSLYQFGEYVPAKLALDEAVELLAEWGPRDREGWARTMLAGLLPHFEPDLEPALAEISRAVEIFREYDNAFGLATALGISGTITTLLGRSDEGVLELDEGLRAAESVGLPSLIGANRSLLALASLTLGDVAAARWHLEAAADVPLYLEGTAFCLEGMAAVALAEGDAKKAAVALGAAEGLRERTGIEAWPVVRLAFQSTVETLDGAGPEVQEARYEGRRSNPRDALARLVASGR